MRGPEAQLREGAARILGSPIAEEQAGSFRAYLDLLESWNRVHRMVGSADRAWMIENVILDSLLFLTVLPPDFRSLLDIGSGAGIPGIPIKIVRPKIGLTMVESRGTRASFLSSAVRSLGLTGARVVRARAETLIEEGARFDVVVARCAGAAAAILDLGARLAAKPGRIVVAGARDTVVAPPVQRVSVTNPVSGGPRIFLVRDIT